MAKKPSKSKLNKEGTGIALLITVDIDNIEEEGIEEALMVTTFKEKEDAEYDPMLMAETLGESIADDFPKHTNVVVGNDRAKYLQWARRMEGMGLDGSVDSYLEIL